jgi:hypothetical protein
MLKLWVAAGGETGRKMKTPLSLSKVSNHSICINSVSERKDWGESREND